jgi:putative ABC transport system permease protein
VLFALPVRTLLLALPVAASTALAVGVLSLDRGVTAKARAAAESWGLDQVTVHGSARQIAGQFQSATTLRETDLEALRSQVHGIPKMVGTRRNNETSAAFGNKSGKYKLFGVTPEWGEVRHFPTEVPDEFLDGNDLQGNHTVCLVGKTVVRELFGGQDPHGQDLLLQGKPFKVKGVLVARGASPAEGDRDARVLIPFTTFLRLFPEKVHLDQIIIQATDTQPDKLDRLAAEVRAVLRQAHNLSGDQKDDFTVRTPVTITEESRAISRSVFLLLLGLAAVFAVVAAAVIGLVFHQAVRARRAEIGLRRALGAERGDILKQIWIEGLLVSLLGGVVGLGLGLGGTYGLAAWRKLPFAFDAPVLAVPLAVVVLTSLAGLLPAREAGHLDPAEALRPTT